MSDARLNVSDRLGRRVVPIDKSPFTIGRTEENDLRVFSSEVSRTHAEIVRADDQYRLHDRGSRYGTFVNGELLKEHTLVDGDRIRLGRSAAVELVFLSQPDESAMGGSLVGAVRQTAALLEGLLRAQGPPICCRMSSRLCWTPRSRCPAPTRAFIVASRVPAARSNSTLGRGRGHLTLSGQTFKTSRKIPEEVFATGETRIVRDLIEGDMADDHLATVALGIRQVLCVPLRLVRYMDEPGAAPEPRRIGVLYLDSRESGTLLSPATRLGVETLATEAAVAIENARLYRETVEKARVDQELRIAGEMQKALRPAARHRGRDFEIAAASVSSRSIGGDFFDYVKLPGEAFGVALGDIAGKGPPAAVLAAALQGMFAAYAMGDVGPGETLTRA